MDNYKIICESNLFLLKNSSENAYLLNKQNNKSIFLGDFYGDPTCGLISENNSFCFVGGLDKCILFKDKNIITIENKNIFPIYDVKQIDYETIFILTDPWSKDSAIWQLNVNSLGINKVRDFLDYKDKKFSDNIIW